MVAHLLDGEGEGSRGVPADGVLVLRSKGNTMRPLREAASLRANLLVAGCDPALGLLGAHLGDRFPAGRLHWVEAGSTAALEMLARGEVNVAGLHLRDEESGQYNVAAVRRRLAGGAWRVVNLSQWEEGLVVAPGNPRKFRRVGDLAGKGVRVVGREPGAGAQQLLLRLAARDGLAAGALDVVAVAHGHLAVAAAVAVGTADAGIATRAAAVSHGLGFVPLEEARFDLVLPAAPDERLERLLDVLASARFRRDLGSVAGYGSGKTGRVMAELSAEVTA
jgi:molybdate-binding protein